MVNYDNNEFNVSSITNTQQNLIEMYVTGHEYTDDEKYNAIQNTTEQLSTMIGKPINIVGALIHPVQFTDKETGELVNAPRMIFIEKSGKTYVSVSATLFGSLKNLIAIKGMPENWPKDGLKVALKQTQRGERRYFSFELIK